MWVVPSEPRRRLSGDHGSALVEAGLMSPVLLFFFLAVIEYGYATGAYLGLSSATADASRSAAVLGNATDADWEIIQAVKTSTRVYDAGGLRKLVVFKAANAASTVPPGCAPQADTSQNSNVVGAQCNGYSLTDFAAPVSQKAFYDCQGVNQRSNGYCPRNRSVAFLPNPPGPDFIGVYLRYDHSYITGLFGDELTIEQTIITRVEPQEVS